MDSINVLFSISQTSLSILAKLWENAHWHVIDVQYKFRWCIPGGLKVMRGCCFSFILYVVAQNKMAAEKNPEGW